MLDVIQRLFKVSDIAQFAFYFVICALIIFGGFWVDLGMVSLILLHKFGKIFSPGVL